MGARTSGRSRTSTSPATSTTGLQATVAAYQFASGQKDRLQRFDLTPEARGKVGSIERATEHYGDSAVLTEHELSAKDGANYASVVALGEVAVLGVNLARKGKDPLVAIYPDEGTFLREEPFYVLDGAWVEANERAAATRLGEFLVKEITPEVAMKADYRPGSATRTCPSAT